MPNWKQSLQLLLDSGSVGTYQYCTVDQIVIEDQSTKVGWNYFTHVTFSSEYTSKSESQLLCTPVTIKPNYKLYISKYQMEKEKFKECIQSAITSGKWNYTDSKIQDGDLIDGAFPSSVKYISENDPTGSSYNNMIPIEMALYGSNFIGNYYVFEIYARKENIGTFLTDTDLKRIQDAIKKAKLNYQLDKLQDRIGNVVCKFMIETLIATPLKLSSFGITYSYELAQWVKQGVNLHFHIEQEHDQLIYEYDDENVYLKPGEKLEKGVEPNQCKTTITVTDVETKLILFRAVSDQSVYSNYLGQITPETVVVTLCDDYREVKLNGKQERIPFRNVRVVDEPALLIEMADAGKRQQKWEEEFFKKQKYLSVYRVGEHNRAISDIRYIINNNLLWDLKEIRLIDPYLSSEDIIKTAAFCEKKEYPRLLPN